MKIKLIDKENIIGKEFDTKSYGKCVVVNYETSLDVLVMFYKPIAIVKCSLDNLRKGAVKNPMYPSVFNKGHIGVGIYSTLNKRAYSLWVSMLNRAYNKDFHLKHVTYKDVTVCEEWHNFQNFAKWCYLNDFINAKDDKGRNYQLDKDILIKGNKIYSPETCCFVPQEINLIFNKSVKDCPTGVNKTEKDFTAFVNNYGIKKYLGTYNNLEDAFDSYKKAKKSYMKNVAEKWKDCIDIKVYNALVNFEINIDD